MKGDKAMKKRIIFMTIVALMFGAAVLPKANAQVFIMGEEEEIGSGRPSIANADFPIVPTQNVTYDQQAYYYSPPSAAAICWERKERKRNKASLLAYLSIIAAFFTALTNISTSSSVLYNANEALTVPGMPNRDITGSAQ